MGSATSTQEVQKKDRLQFNEYRVDINLNPKHEQNYRNRSQSNSINLSENSLTTNDSRTHECISDLPNDDDDDDIFPNTQLLPCRKSWSFENLDNIVDDINEIFEYIKLLGSGGSSRVLLARHRENGNVYALKELSKANHNSAKIFAKETSIYKYLANENNNIVSYFDSFMDDQCYYIATDYCPNGTLLDKLLSTQIQMFSESDVIDIIETLLQSIEYIHGFNIVHRDLKLKNLVFDEKHNLKIIDFGDSDVIIEDNEYSKGVGTLHYMPPEIFNEYRTGSECKKSDMWSLGVITYVLLFGKIPFYGDSNNEIIDQIRSGVFTWPSGDNDNDAGISVSSQCKSFVSQLLSLDCDQRLSAKEALNHPWILNYKNNNNNNSLLLKT